MVRFWPLILLTLLALAPMGSFHRDYLRSQYDSSTVVLGQKGKNKKDLLRMTLTTDDQYRLWSSYEEIPPLLKEAFLHKEDRFFFYHPGFNSVALARSLVKTMWLQTSRSGASTITMQLARLHFGLHTKTLWGKAKQIAAAYYLEVLLSKEDILEAYVSLAPFGRNIVGARAAAQIYFKKNLENINSFEASLLAVIPQHPSLLHQHQSLGVIDQKIHDKASGLHQKMGKKSHHLTEHSYFYGVDDLPFKAPHFVDWVLTLEEGERELIQTSLDVKVQTMTQDLVKNYVRRYNRSGLKNAAVMILDHRSMQIKSMVGSADFFDQSIHGQVNGTLAPRSPGSTLKPFIYALAAEQGLIIPETLLFDAPLPYKTPENYDNRYLGPITAQDSLILSRNVPAVYLATKLKKPSFHDFLHNLYRHRLGALNIYGTSLSLGGVEFSMKELVELYASLANRGRFHRALYVRDQAKGKGKQIIDAGATAMVMDMLSHHQRPGLDGGHRYLEQTQKVFWKTGTSFGFRDAWSIGVVGPYVVAAWVGNFNGEGHPSLIGKKAAGPLFFEVIDRLKPLMKKEPFNDPSFATTIKEVQVCALSGRLPGKHCPHHKMSLFIPETSSIERCTLHRHLSLRQDNGLRACAKTKVPTVSKIYEVWPSHALAIFKRLGLPRTTPPAFSRECLLEERKRQGHEPEIITPRLGLEYTYRFDDSGDNKKVMSFKAKVDSDVKQIFWYVNQEYLGAQQVGQDFFWQVRPGKFTIRAVDDQGRATSRKLSVLFLGDRGVI